MTELRIHGTPAGRLATDHRLQVFTTCPPSADSDPATYRERALEIARWSEAAGCVGMLVYTDNRLLDPWLVGQSIIEHTERICPLIAVQPAYMHPYTAAKMVVTLAALCGRRVWLNLVAGGFRNDLRALADVTPHDERYDRLVEYGLIVTALLGRGGGPVTFDGAYYRTRNLRMTPELPPELFPGMTVSGSSDAGLRAAAKLGAVPVKYPQPAADLAAGPATKGLGIRIGILARQDREEAWEEAGRRFPVDRRGQITHSLAMATTDSKWHLQLSAIEEDERSTYWLHPFRNYQTFCPYLVGDYETVAAEVRRYLDAGVSTIILDVPRSSDDLAHVAAVLDRARERARA
jgi:alkanesulfonate monooxygenase